MDRQLRLAAAIYALPGARERRSPAGESWIDHHCLFHDDRHRSASYQPETWVYWCHACGHTFSVDEVERRLLLSATAARPSSGGGDRESTPLTAPSFPPIVRTLQYRYTRPDGTLTAIHLRQEHADGSKASMPWQNPDGSFGRPQNYWPIYDESQLALDQILLVVEGEKCVDAVNARSAELAGHPLRAITVGGTTDLRLQAKNLALRCQQLVPAALLLWPDQDPQGLEAMGYAKKAFNALHLVHAVVEPLELELGPGQDVADYLARGGSLEVVLQRYWPSLAAQQNGQALLDQRLSQLVEQTRMVSPKKFLYPGTHNLDELEVQSADSLWFTSFHGLPPTQINRHLRARLREKGHQHPTDVAFRHLAVGDRFWWRPARDELPYCISADPLQRSEPPDTLLLAPVRSYHPWQVDEQGSEVDFERFCQGWGLDGTSQLILAAWLVTAFCGRKCPILLFKGPAATGKTTLATYLGALLDPELPTITVRRTEQDVREFFRTAQRHPALLLDNLSQVSGEFEDVLSRLVTGESASLRLLYEDVVETLHLQRAILVTTTSWDVSKGDLASRIWPLETDLPNHYLDDDALARSYLPLLPRLRGYLFSRCRDFFRYPAPEETSALRLGARALRALGADPQEIALALTATKSRVITEGEPWLDALCEVWLNIKESGPYQWKPTQLAYEIGRLSGEQITTKALVSFVRPRQALFPTYGFELDWGRESGGARYYHFSST